MPFFFTCGKNNFSVMIVAEMARTKSGLVTNA